MGTGRVGSGLGIQTAALPKKKHLTINSCFKWTWRDFCSGTGTKLVLKSHQKGLRSSHTKARREVIHALATVKDEKEFLRQVPSKLLPLYVRMEQAFVEAVGRN